MSNNENRRPARTERRIDWDRMRARSASEMLSVLDPTRQQSSILTMGLWKMSGPPKLQGAVR